MVENISLECSNESTEQAENNDFLQRCLSISRTVFTPAVLYYGIAVPYYGIRCAVLWNPLCCIMASANRRALITKYFTSDSLIQHTGYVNNYVRNCSGQLLSHVGRNLKQSAISTSFDSHSRKIFLRTGRSL